MAFLQKNICLAFYAVVLLLSVLFAGALYFSYLNTHAEVAAHQKSLTQITANSLRSKLREYQVIGDLIVHELSGANHHDIATIDEDFEKALEVEPSLISASLFKENGTLVNSSDKEFATLLYSRVVEENIIEQCSGNEKLVLGRTFIDAKSDTTVLPIVRCYAQSRQGDTDILVLAINADKGFDFFINSHQDELFYDTYLFRDRDRYFQLAPSSQANNSQIYAYQTPKSVIQQEVDRLVQKVGIPLEQIKRSTEIYLNEHVHPSRQSLSATTFIQAYELWLTTEMKLSYINTQFIRKMWALIFLFLGSLITIFMLFRMISVSENKKRQALLFQAHHDSLTRLNNRNYLESQLIQLSEASSLNLSLILIDMDNFKSVNDSYGHALGDMVLKEVASRLRVIASRDDTLIRYSSDEFIIVKHDVSRDSLTKFCEQLLEVLHKPYRVQNHQFILSASIGLARLPLDGNSLEEVKRYADMALYESKKERNKLTFFENELKQAFILNSQIEQAISHGLANDEFYLLYQPQISRTGRLHGVEALLRWNSEKFGFISPAQFIPIAESSGVMPELGKFVIEKAFTEVIELKEKLKTDFELSINVSVMQFIQENFLDEFFSLVESHRYKNTKLVVEITENLFIDHVLDVKQVLEQLRSSGIKVSLDDFGTGYSSLSMLKSLPIDELKIDKSFIDDILIDNSAMSILEGIVSMAKKLGLLTVAEGVELEIQKEILFNLGCDLFQGYYFAKPLSINELEKFIVAQER